MFAQQVKSASWSAAFASENLPLKTTRPQLVCTVQLPQRYATLKAPAQNLWKVAILSRH